MARWKIHQLKPEEVVSTKAANNIPLFQLVHPPILSPGQLLSGPVPEKNRMHSQLQCYSVTPSFSEGSPAWRSLCSEKHRVALSKCLYSAGLRQNFRSSLRCGVNIRGKIDSIASTEALQNLMFLGLGLVWFWVRYSSYSPNMMDENISNEDRNINWLMLLAHFAALNWDAKADSFTDSIILDHTRPHGDSKDSCSISKVKWLWDSLDNR